MPVSSGWLIDKIGPRLFMTLGGLVCGAGWAAMSQVNSLTTLYVLLCGYRCGRGLRCIADPWALLSNGFPDKRGLATGLTSAAFGSGAAFFIPIIAHVLHSSGYRTAFIYSGVAQGLLIMCAAQFLRSPQLGEVAVVPAKAKIRSHGEEFSPVQMMRTGHFYIMYMMMFVMGVGGLMVTAQLAPLADSFKISATALTIALSMNPIANGASRLFWGWVSDHMGRERSMVVAFLIQSVALLSIPHPGAGFRHVLHRVHGNGVLQLGRDLRAVPHAHGGHLRLAQRQCELRIPVQHQRGRLDCGRRARGDAV